MKILTTRHLAMPQLGLGTWRLRGEECARSVARAIGLGYRHIDTATMYENEAAVGEGIRASGLRREEIFLTSKVWYENLAPDALRRSFEASRAALDTPYLDLFLIHWPAPGMDLAAALNAMMRLQREGLVKAIGVSNFTVALMREAIEKIGAPIACNQVEYHVLRDQAAVLGYARAHDVVVTAYCPLAQGRLADFALLAEIAHKHAATPAQIALAWLLEQDNVAAIPKAGREESQRANLAALDIRLDDADRAAIASLPKDQRFVDPGWAPAWDKAA